MQNQILSYIKTWEGRCYSNGIPDTAPAEIFGKVPSYHRIALCILRNDHALQGLGFTPVVSEYYNIYKRIELGLPLIKKSKKMTINEKKNKCFTIAKALIKETGYIKGYGQKLDRLMTGAHHPMENIPKEFTKILESNNLIYRDGMVLRATKKASDLKNDTGIIIVADKP